MNRISDNGAERDTLELESWIEWRCVCALGRCSQSVANLLQSRLKIVFCDLQRNIAESSGLSLSADVLSSSASCWHLFESHITAGRNCNGKALKQWLFARVARSNDPALKVVRGGVRKLARDALRVNIIKEMPNKHCIGIDMPVQTRDGLELNVENLLPTSGDDLSEVERREIAVLAHDIAGEIFDCLAFTQRVVLLAKALKISLAHPLVAEVAGLRKSMMNRIWHDALKNLVELIDHRFASEDRQVRFLIAEMAIEDQKNRIISWSRVEKRCAKLLDNSREV